jgi:hypothetical protein
MTGYVVLAFSCMTVTWNHWRSTGTQFLHAPALLALSSPGTRSDPSAGGGPDENAQPATHLLPVLLSIEPVGTTADSDIDTSVVFPGYLLPDDNREEPAHGGS